MSLPGIHKDKDRLILKRRLTVLFLAPLIVLILGFMHMAARKSKLKTSKLTFAILIGLLLGVVVGLVMNATGPTGVLQAFLINYVFDTVGQIFVASLKLLVVPLVFISLVCGTSSLGSLRDIGKIGGKTMGLYLVTTALAVSFALVFALFFSPGMGFNLTSDAVFAAKEAPSLKEVLIGIFPTNPVKAMAEGNMLQIIVFSILVGYALNLSGESGKRIKTAFNDMNEVVMKLVMLLMLLTPYGAFALVAKVFAEQGFEAFGPLLKYFFTVVFVLLIHVLFTYPFLLKILSGLNPVQFFKNWKAPLALAFSTSSSNATMPVTLETIEHKCGVDNSVASFTIPLGATINMDGTAIMQGVATIFVAQAYGIDLSLTQLLMVVVTATLASIGTAGVPGVGLIMLAMVFRQVGLPLEGIGLILGVDRLLDMMRTAVNVSGDGIVSCIVAKSEKKFSEKIYYQNS